MTNEVSTETASTSDRVFNTSDQKNSGFSIRRLLALCYKETLQIIRDPSSIAIAFILPIVLLLIFGFGISLDSNRMRIGIVMEDSGVHARNFAMAVVASPYIDPVFSHSRTEMQAFMDNGQVRGMVVIPSDFSKKVEQGSFLASSANSQMNAQVSSLARIQVLTDGSQPNTANFVANYVQGTWLVWQQATLNDAGASLQMGIEPVMRYWFNPTTVSRNYLIPGAISVIMTMIGALLTSMVIAREWERGTMEALLATPMTKIEFLLSKIIPYYILGMLSMAICVIMATTLMQVPFRGSFFMLFVSASLFMGSALGMGLLISTVSRSQFNAAQIALNAAFLPAVLLSGFMFEITSMPKVIQFITYVLPSRYFVTILQTLFQAGQVWYIIGMNLLFLLVLAVFWLGLTAMKTRVNLNK